MKRPLRLLLIEDSEEDAELLLAELKHGGFDVFHRRVDSAAGVSDALITGNWDIAISDYTMPQFTGMEAISIVHKHDPDMPIIITSGNIGEDIAVEAMRAGAHDYLMKDNLSRLIPAINRELRESVVRRDARMALLKLEESEARFRTMASNLPGMVFQLLVDAGGTMAFTYVSEGSERLLDLPPADLINDSKGFFSRLPNHDRSELQTRIQLATVSMSPLSWEGSICGTRDDTPIWILVRMRPRRLNDGRIQWDGIVEDVSRRKQAELELLQSRQQLSALSSHLQKAKEAERTSIAREVHDDIGGNLTAIKIDLLWLINRIGSRDPEAVAKAHSMEFLADRTLEITSRIARDLRPPLLELGLLAAVEWEAAEFSKRMEIPCAVSCSEDDIALEPEFANALFSVFREALTNIAKHAQATRVDVELEVDDQQCILRVIDDGRGFVQSDLLKEQSFGLRGMLERMRNLGGEIRFGGGPGAGATITASLPLGNRARHENL